MKSGSLGRYQSRVVIVGISIMAIFSVAVAFLIVEIAYRQYLYWYFPSKFVQPPASSTFLFFRDSVWQYDQDAGYRYKPDQIWFGGFVENGRLAGCDASSKTDARGNMGQSGVNYAAADVKVLVFGDSVTSQPANNTTYPSLFEVALSKHLGLSASVINLGRDGYGVLQMIDLAKIEIPRWKPDLVLIDFITDDVDRDRFWRTEMQTDGRARVFTTTVPNALPPPALRTDTMILEPAASLEWCDRAKSMADPSSDPIMHHLAETYALATAHISGRPGLWDLDYSVVIEALLNGDPFAFVWRRLPPGTNPRINRDKYDDPRLVDGMKALKGYGVPIYFVHLPVQAEIKQGAYVPTNHKAALLSDFERILGSTVNDDLPLIHATPEELDRFPVSPADRAHPSAIGMQVYADSLVDMLDRAGALRKWTASTH